MFVSLAQHSIVKAASKLIAGETVRAPDAPDKSTLPQLCPQATAPRRAATAATLIAPIPEEPRRRKEF